MGDTIHRRGYTATHDPQYVMAILYKSHSETICVEIIAFDP